nr:AIR synthase related protein [Candidatus Neomarinimicrobiota bacterium]
AKEVTEGFLYDRTFETMESNFTEPMLPDPEDYNQVLLDILSHENMASREPIFEQYDKQVQGRIHTETGLADSGVMAPFNSEKYPEEIRNIGIAISTDHNPRYGQIDPYWGGINAVVESMRNVAAVGATPHALSDCLCFGNPEKPHQMWEFVESVRGVADACRSITLKDNPDHATPIIAGNVSFYNESKSGAIPPSPIVSCLGKLKDVNKTVPAHFQRVDSVLMMIGERKNELGGSVYYSLHNELGANIPKPGLEEVKNQIFALADCIDDGLVLSCHDISDGGVASALAELTFGNGIGCNVNTDGELPNNQLLFSETGGFIVEVSSENVKAIITKFLEYGLDIFEIGKTGGTSIQMNNIIDISVNETKEAWTNGLREKL